MTIKKKLLSAFGAIALTSLLSAGLGMHSINKLHGSIKDMSGRSSRATYYAGQIDTITSDLQAQQRGMIFRRLLKQESRSDQLIHENEESVRSLRHVVTLLQPLVVSPDVERELQGVSAQLEIIERDNSPFLKMVRENRLD